jgi:type I restriction enzyme S subunit
MNLETFFEKFELFADAPNAVAKMRELILHMAVGGKLVPQDPSDESGRDLIARIDREMRDEVRLRRASPLPELPVECVQFELPEQWVWAQFRDVAVIASNLVNPNDYLDFIHLAPDNIEKGNGVLLRCATVREDKVISSNHRFRAGQIVYSKIRPNLAKVVVVNFDGLCSADMYPIDALIDANYLHRYMLSASFLIQAVKTDTRVAMPKINQAELNVIAVPVPPLAEQKRIVAKVDELMTLCDQLEAQQRERETQQAALARAAVARFADAPTPANIELLFHESYSVSPTDLRKTILTLAVQGKLVPQDPNDEPAEVTVPKIAAATVVSDNGNDAFPAHWLKVPLRSTGEWRGGGTPSKSRLDFWQGDIPWVSPKDMKMLLISDAQDHISNSAIEGSSVRMIPSGSLLMVVRGMILARAFPVALTTREVTINQDMKALSPWESETKEFLLVALRAFESEILRAVERSTHGTCKLSTEFLEEFIVGIPPLAEQRRIVAKVDQLMALVDQLEVQLAASRAAAVALMDALVVELTEAGMKIASSTAAFPGKKKNAA